MISIITPVLNEETYIIPFLENIISLPEEKELIIVDGQSTDNTCNLIREYISQKEISNIKVISSTRGRGIQLHAGASHASGEILWFVHIDSKISSHSLSHILDATTQNYLYGCFALNFFDCNKASIKLIAFGSRLRSKYLHIILGDQALFIKKDFYNFVGGFSTQVLMEDYDFSKKLIKAIKQYKKKYLSVKKTPIMLDIPIKTSARKFIKKGVFNTFLMMQIIKFLYCLQIPIPTIQKIYNKWCYKS